MIRDGSVALFIKFSSFLNIDITQTSIKKHWNFLGEESSRNSRTSFINNYGQRKIAYDTLIPPEKNLREYHLQKLICTKSLHYSIPLEAYNLSVCYNFSCLGSFGFLKELASSSLLEALVHLNS